MSVNLSYEPVPLFSIQEGFSEGIVLYLQSSDLGAEHDSC